MSSFYTFQSLLFETKIGLWPSWNDVGNFFYNIGESFITSVEAEVGAVGFLAKKEVKKFTFSIGSGVGFTIGYSR